MALRDQPYIPLYVQDYLTDEKLNACSPATQGVYIKIMCILHKSDEYGKILLKQKDKQNESKIKNFANKLNKQLTFSIEDIESALIELIEEKVMTIEGDVLYQKRMVKDGEISEKRAFAANCSVASRNKNENFATANRPANRSAKRGAKSQQNPEYESEYVNEDVIVIEDEDESGDEKEPTLQDMQFDMFWKAYPRKVGKGAARKAWAKVKPNAKLFSKIMSAVDTAKKSKEWLKDGGQYIPHPTTWLNQGRWDDEYPDPGSPDTGADAPLPPGWKFSDIDMGGEK